MHLKRPYVELPLAFEKLGFETLVVCGTASEAIRNKTNVILTGEKNYSILGMFKEFPKILKLVIERKPNLVILFTNSPANLLLIPFVRLAKLYFNIRNVNKTSWGIKFVLKVDSDGTKHPTHSSIVTALRRLLLSLMSYLVDYIVSETTCGSMALRKNLLIQRSKVKVIPNSYSHSYEKVPYDNNKREKIILSVARVSPEKSLDVLINSFSKISVRYPDWNLYVVGPIEDKVYYQKLKDMAKLSNISEKVVFTNTLFNERLNDLYACSSIFCLPSTFESFGIVRIEAIANGLPLITTYAGCGIDFESLGAWIVPAGDIGALTEKLLVLIKDEELRKTMVKNMQRNLPSYRDVVKMFIDLMPELNITSIDT